MGERGGRKRAAMLLVVAAAVPLGLLPGAGAGRGPPARADPEDDAPARATPGVLVAMHLDEPLAPDRTVVWTAAFQAAWDALDDQVRARWRVARLDLGPPAPPADVRALAKGRLVAGTVDRNDLTVIAGPATEATWDSIGRASDLGRPAGAPPARDLDLVAFARLEASIRYEVPFHVGTRALPFGASRTPVRAYGLEANASGSEADRMREQVDLHLDPAPSDTPARRSVVVLKGVGGRRVLISGRPPKATLRATWDDVADAVRRTPASGFSMVDRLEIPRVSIVAGRSFDALLGAAVPGIPASRLAVAREDVRLAADEKGADVDAEAVLVEVGAMSKAVVFDGPFLLAMCAGGSERPYALAWIGSADGLSRWGEPVGRPLLASEAEPFVGAWTLERDASVEATLVRWGKALARNGRRWSPERERGQLRRHFRGASLETVVAADGLVTITRAGGGDPPETLHVALVRDGARVLLPIPTAHAPVEEEESEPVHAEPSAARPGAGEAPRPHGEERFFVSRDGDRLVLTQVGGGVTLVLVRR